MAEMQEVYTDQVDATIETDRAPKVAAAAKRAEEMAALAKEIGLADLATQDHTVAKVQKAIAWCEARGIVPLSAEDRRVWMEWLPTAYATETVFSWDVPHGAFGALWGGEKNWHNYSYHEGVPMNIRRLIAEVKDLFPVLEIRTPEKQPVALVDPALFGHVIHANGERDIVLLARWAESDVNWVSFDDIKRILATRKGAWDPGRIYQTFCDADSFDAWGALAVISALSMLGGMGVLLLGKYLEWWQALGASQPALLLTVLACFIALPSMYLVFNHLSSRWKRWRLAQQRPDLESMI